MVDDVQRVAGLGDVHPRQRPEGAADQEQVAHRRQLGEPGHGAQLRLDDAARAAHVALRPVGEADGADGQRGGPRHAPALQPHQLERAAAKVAQHALGLRHAEQQPLGGKPRLLIAGEDAHRGARHARADAGDELRAVGRVAHGGRRQHLERRGLHPLGEDLVARGDGQRLRRGLVVQPAGLVQAAAEAEHGLLVEDGVRVAPRALEDDEPHRVGAEVHHAEAGLARRGGRRLARQHRREVHGGGQSCSTRLARGLRGARAGGAPGAFPALPRPDSEGFVMK